MARGGYGTPPGYEGVKPGKNAKPRRPSRKPADIKPPALPAANRPGQRPSIVPVSLPAIPVVAPPIVSTTAVTSVPGVATPEWWRNQYTSDPRYLAQAPQLSQEYSNIGEQYGLVVGRVTDAASPYYGRVIFRTGGEAPGSGSIVQDFDATTGRPVYRNIATGEIVQVDPQTLALDIRELRPDEPGYRGGRLGGARLESAGRQVKIGEQASQAGARSSGMRIVGSSAEIQLLQDSLANIARLSGESLADVNRRYMELYNEIYQDLLKNPPAGPPSTTAITSVTSVAAPPPPPPTSGVGEPNVFTVPEVPVTIAGGYVAGAQVPEITIDRAGVSTTTARETETNLIAIRNEPKGGWRVGNIVNAYRGTGKNKGYEIQFVVVGVNPLRLKVQRVKSNPPRTGVNAGAWT